MPTYHMLKWCQLNLLLGQYRFFNDETIDIAIYLGMKLPTRDDRDKDIENIRFESEFQQGSGSNDYLLGLTISKRSEIFNYHANILYNKTTEGSQETEIGDVFSYNLAMTYKFNKIDHHHSHTHTDWQWGGIIE